MPDGRGRKTSIEALIPDDRRAWAQDISAGRQEIAKLSSGAWMLREQFKPSGCCEPDVPGNQPVCQG